MINIIDRLFGYDKKAEIIHDQKNRYTSEMLGLQLKMRRQNKTHADITAYRVSMATGRTPNYD